MNKTDVLEFAELPHVPILKMGDWPAHNAAFPVSIDDLDSILSVTNESQDILQEAIDTGTYRGNEHLELTKAIPAIMNVHHQELFPDTKVNDALKDAFRNVTATYQQEHVDGEDWLTATYHNVPNGSAATLQKHFPLRSVELLPNFTNPDTGQTAPWVIRSTAFLNQATKPAVTGQRPDLIVEFAADESPVLRLTSTFQGEKEPSAMATEQPDKTVGVDVAEFEAAQQALAEKDAELVELRAKIADAEQSEQEKDKTVAELQAEQRQMRAEVAEMQKTIDANEVKELCHVLRDTPRLNLDNHAFVLAKAATDVLFPAIQSKGVIEMQDGESSPRHAFVNRMGTVLEMAAKGTLLVPVSSQEDYTFADPDHTQPKDLHTAVMEFAKAHPETYPDPAKKDYERASDDFLAANPDFIEEVA